MPPAACGAGRWRRGCSTPAPGVRISEDLVGVGATRPSRARRRRPRPRARGAARRARRRARWRTPAVRRRRRRARAGPARAGRRRSARAAGFATRGLEVALAGRGVERDVGHGQRVEVAAHRGQRRAQLVRHVGEHLAAHAVGLAQRVGARRQLGRHPVEGAGQAARSRRARVVGGTARSPAPIARRRASSASAGGAPAEDHARRPAPPRPAASASRAATAAGRPR